MDATIFWDLLEQACEMGKFIAAIPNSAASANIVGKLQLGDDGGERVLEKKKCPACHVHFRPEHVAEFAFIHIDVGFGPGPCLEIRSTEGQPVLRLYYRGKKAAEKRYDEFMRNNSQHEAFITGSWSQSSEVTHVEPIIVSTNNNTAREGDAARDESR